MKMTNETARRELKKHLIRLVAAGILLAFAIGAAFGAAALSRYGSRGSEVTKIQEKLKRWGYYSGAVDGIYGPKTYEAVRYFQRKNGLTVDGIAGPKTLAAMGISSGSGSGSSASGGYGGYGAADCELLARVISAEARGEPYSGQVAVGAVVLNRVRHPSFPNSVSGVVYQAGAFSCVNDGQINMAPAASAYRAAKDAINGVDPSGGAIYYYNPKTAKSKRIRSRRVICTRGAHVFCM